MFNAHTSLFLQPTAVFCDAAQPWQLGFQDPATPIHEGIINLHHDIMFFLVVVFVLVFTVIGAIIYGGLAKQKNPSKFYYFPITHNAPLEFVWTLLPSLILIVIAIPSFALIYSMDDIIDAKVTIKVIGHQWYWTYEYGDMPTNPEEPFSRENKSLSVDSYMIPEADLPIGTLRLLEVDNRLLLPKQQYVRLLITSADVLHSWAVPSLGVKMDACPGRLNQVGVYINREGVFYGQCSEICGINHAFMPIVVETY